MIEQLLTEIRDPSIDGILDGIGTQPLYVLFDEKAYDLISQKAAMLDPVLATTDFDAASWLSEQLSYPIVMVRLSPDLVQNCKLESAVENIKQPEKSMAMSGFLVVSGGPFDPSKISRITPSEEDIVESIKDMLENMTQSVWPIVSKYGKNGITKSWLCESVDQKKAIVLSNRSEIRPWKIFQGDPVEASVEALSCWNESSTLTFWNATNNDPWSPREEMILEYARKKTSSTMRLKRVVMDALLANEELPGKLRDVVVSGDKMTIKIGRKTYWFDVKRDEEGWVRSVDFERPKGKEEEVEFVKKAITDSFKEASLFQVMEDACSEKKPKLIMLDYILKDPSSKGAPRRKTRLVESYSFRRKYKYNRRYFYGWNVEEGGIRSYIVENIQGARKTDIPFKPRFLVEIGIGKRLREGIAYPIKRNVPETVSDSAVRRGHERYELSGGRGKIIKRLGQSVRSPKPKKKKKS
jgi:hypothetical protein